MAENKALSSIDKEIDDLINLEKKRQSDHLELIASENYTSCAVMQAQGSILTNKYAEGYPKNRYYGGCEHVDAIESIAINRAKQLFNAPYANVQPHSGSQANQAVFFATLKPNDTVLGLSLNCGGHLTHGSSVNLSGKLFNFIHYGLDQNEYIDYNQVSELAMQHKPKMIIAGASAYSRIIDFKKFREIADISNSYLMVDMAHYAGLIAAGIYPNPMPYADFVTSTTHKTLRGPRGGIILAQEQYAKLLNSSIFPGLQGGPLEHVIAAKAVAFKEALSSEFITYQKNVVLNAQAMASIFTQQGVRVVSGGTDTHLMLLDISKTGLSGKVAQELLDAVYITTNKNSIPNDQTSPNITSGIRIGTPAITTRGLLQQECISIASMIVKILHNPHNTSIADEARNQVISICNQFPLLT